MRGWRHILVAIALLWASATWADRLLEGRVVSVADGDTLTVQDTSGQTHRVRLVGIDAPERDQPHGLAARDALAAWVMDRAVRVEHERRDTYRRILGTVYVGDDNINWRLIREGHAWHAKPFQHEQPVGERWRYAWAQWQARWDRAGLWQADDPVAPWQHRREQRGQGSTREPAASPGGS